MTGKGVRRGHAGQGGAPGLICHRTGGVADIGFEDFCICALRITKVLEERGLEGGMKIHQCDQ